MTKSVNVFETQFPMFCVRFLGDRHVVVAGGGGQAKTGVPNCLEIYLFDVEEGSWEFRKAAVCSTGLEATMNMDVFTADADCGRFLIACGQGGKCTIYTTEYDLANFVNNILVDKTNSKNNSHTDAKPVTKISLRLKQVTSFETDFPTSPSSGTKAASAEAFQKTVKFSADGALLATGGTDGTVRLFKVANLLKCKPQPLLECKLHAGDIDDLDFSADSKYLATAGRDSQAFIIDTNTGAKIASLSQANFQALPEKYRFRFAKFVARIKTTTLLTVCVPIAHAGGSKRRSQACFGSLWTLNCNRGKTECKLELKSPLPIPAGDAPSCIALSNDGRYVALGSLGGAVVVLQTNADDHHQWRPIKMTPHAHSIFVTSLAFAPTAAASRPQSPLCSALRTNRCALLSVSADNCARWHAVPRDDVTSTAMTSFSARIAIAAASWLFVYYVLIFLQF